MVELITSFILPVTFLYILPFIFGVWFINKEITASKLNTRAAWMICLFLTPQLTLAIFYFVEVRIRRVNLKV